MLLEVSGFPPDNPEVDDPSELPLVSLLVLVSSTPIVVAEEAAPVLVSPDPEELPSCIEVDVGVPSSGKVVVVGRAGAVLLSSPKVLPASPVMLVLVCTPDAPDEPPSSGCTGAGQEAKRTVGMMRRLFIVFLLRPQVRSTPF